MSIHTDIAIIGGGPGGYVAALRAAQLGAQVTLIEKKRVGGVCLNEGCIPTKALLRSAEVFALVQEAATYGVRVGEPEIDWPVAQARKDKVVEQVVGGVEFLLKRAGVEVLNGEASFSRARTLAVQLADGRETVEAERVVIATGARTLQVPIPGLDGAHVIDHWGALQLEALPERVLIIGAGAIGLEFASLFRAFGVEVTLVEMLPRLAPIMDVSIGEGLAWSMERRGIEIMTSTRVASVEEAGEGCVVTMQGQDGEERREVNLVLSAIGRTPNTERLGLETIGLQPIRQGIRVDDHMRTAAQGVYAVGDVAAEGAMLAHVASHQGIVAVEDALGHPARMDYTAVPSGIFTLPEAASVGLTEEQAHARGIACQVGIFALPNSGKAVAAGDTEGFVKVMLDAETDALIGVHIVGPHANDLIMEGTMALALEATFAEVTRTIHPHPTLTEAIHEATLAARHSALHLPKRS